MTTQTLQSAPLTAAPPRVNLMPPEIAEAARFRQIQVMLGAAVLFAVVVVGLLYVNAHKGVSSAQDQVDAAQAQHTSLETKLSQLASVQQTLDEVQSKQALLATAMGAEVRWSAYLTDVAFRMPSNVWLTSMEVTEDATSTAPPTAAGAATLGAAAPATATAFPIGTVTFDGVGFVHDDVAKWLDGMAKVKGFLNPTFTNSAEGLIGQKNVVDFTGTVGLTSDLFSGRYALSATPTGTTPTAPAATNPDSTGFTTVPGTGIAAP